MRAIQATVYKEIFALVLFPSLSPSILLGEFKIGQIPLWAGIFKTGPNHFQVKKCKNTGNPVYSISITGVVILTRSTRRALNSWTASSFLCCSLSLSLSLRELDSDRSTSSVLFLILASILSCFSCFSLSFLSSSES